MPEPLLKTGLHPKASDALRRVPIPVRRIGQVIGTAADSAGYHLAEPGNDAPGRFWIINGHRYCAATDVRVLNPSQLTESEIINLLERLARQGFAAWYRKPGFDGWPRRSGRTGNPTQPHIHIVYAGIPMKAVLRDQVVQFINRRNGLANGPYSFHRFSEAALAKVKQDFEAGGRGQIQSIATPQDADAITALAFDAGFEGEPAYFSQELSGIFAEGTVIEVEDATADEADLECACGCDGDELETDLAHGNGVEEADNDVTPNTSDDYEALQEYDPEGDIVLGDEGEVVEAAAARPWRAAESLLQLRRQVNARAPQRSKASDGTIGDDAHRSRESDHNAWIHDGSYDVVSAIDITHDPAHGCNVDTIIAAIIASRDTRVKYIIRNRRILSSYVVGGAAAWTWRSYTGVNPHTKHVHISVKATKALYDSTAAWRI